MPRTGGGHGNHMNGIDDPGRSAGTAPATRDEALCDPARVLALVESGLSAAPDADLEMLAERVRRRLRVPVALVSLVQPDQQVFPGMAGLPSRGPAGAPPRCRTRSASTSSPPG